MSKQKKQKKSRTLRLLPITVTMLSLLFIIKMNELYFDSQKLRDMYGVREAAAEDKKDDKKAEDKKDDSKKDEAKKDEVKKDEKASESDKKSADAKPEDKKSDDKGDKKEGDKAADIKVPEGEIKEGENKDKPKEGAAKSEDKKDAKEGDKKDAKEGDKKEGDKKEGEKKEGEKGAKEPEEPKTYGTGKSTIKEIEELKAKDEQPRFSKTELDLLQNLTKRREELDQRERDLDMKSKVLDATDKRITDKISEMKVLQVELSKVLAQYNEKQDGQIKSLVKIYENMKPDEAAAIFNELEMPILLDVIGKMSERKVALVLANMSPKKARDVTQELAEKRKKALLDSGAPAKP